MSKTSEVVVDVRCEVKGKIGTVRYVGHTSFASGKWVGVELDEPSGKNDGSVDGTHYFDCRPGHGVFFRASQVRLLSEPITLQQTQSQTSFAPPNEINGVRSIRPPSIVGLSKLNNGTAASGIPSRQSTKGPNTPTNPRYSLRRMSGQSFTRRSRGNSDASSIDGRKFDIDSLEYDEDMSEMNDSNILTEESESFEFSESDLINSLSFKQDSNNRSDMPQRPESMIFQDPFSLQETSATREQTIPLKDYEELRLKLKILENKRQDDREKFRENEKLRAEAEQFLSVKPKLQAKMTEMQQELRELRKQMKDITAEKDLFENKFTESMESMEIMTLDKEMAEEKAENLQHEVNLLKEKIEEISVDLNVFKQEGDMISQIDGEGRTTLETIQLERHNARLKEALVKLRDMAGEQEADLNKKIKFLEKELANYHELQAHSEQLKQKLELAESQVEDLKDRLDDAVHADEMLEALAEKDLAQGEVIKNITLSSLFTI
nr:15014_t:CDS:2 [Entrophospora candida]